MQRFSKHGLIASFIIALCGLTFACSNRSNSKTVPVVTDIPFQSDGTLTFQRVLPDSREDIASITIEIADTDSSRQRGLMERHGIPADRGMLFVFPFADMQGFWMGNTQSSLDLLFISADSVINDIHKYVKPLSTETVAGREPAQYVLEVVAGYVDTQGIVIGDRIAWEATEAKD